MGCGADWGPGGFVTGYNVTRSFMGLGATLKCSATATFYAADARSLSTAQFYHERELNAWKESQNISVQEIAGK